MKETPLSEMTLRRYEKPTSLSEREIVRKICLSVGLLQPGDSRDIIVDILFCLLRNKDGLSSAEVEEHVIAYRQEKKLPVRGVAGSNIRRQLKRLKDVFLIEKKGGKYMIKRDETMDEIFSERILRYYLDSITVRIREYFKMAEEQVRKK